MWTCREGLISELRGSMYSLLDAFKGDYTQQAAHYEQRMRQLQDILHSQVAASCPTPAAWQQQPGTWQHDVCSLAAQ